MTLRAAVRVVLSLGLAVQLACLPTVKERCHLVTEPSPAPALPPGFAEVDRLLIRRAMEMVQAARELQSAHVWDFRVTFAEQTLPLLCERLERARALALVERTAEAGRKYQALLVASQVVQMAVAMHAMAQYADRSGQAGGQIQDGLARFAAQIGPILEAALTENPQRIERTLTEHREVFATWVGHLEQWPLRVEDAAKKAAAIKLAWDVVFLVVATYQAAGAAAELVAAGRPPMPPLPVFAAGGGAAAGISPAAYVELAEALRKLIVLGALDTGVVVALSKTFGSGLPSTPAPLPPVQMSGGQGGADPLKGARPWKDGAYHGPKPKYENPGHHDPSSGRFRGGGSQTTILPKDAGEVFKTAIPDQTGRTWYGRNATGEYYRYSASNGSAHWSGQTQSGRGLDVPRYIRERFEALE